MYCKHFGIESKPFSITPDPRFLFLSDRHREALAHLLFGVGEGGGFVQLTGEVGTGKTTLCRALLEQLPESVDVALILNPKLTGFELVAAICDELDVDYPRETQSLKVLIDRLNHHLLESHAAGRRTVAVIDEAQNLAIDVLEQVRLLTNLETAQAKLLQIILIGQPELQAVLAREDLRQLAQRITARYHLGELDRDDTRSYIAHRLRVAGGHADLFSTDAMDEVYRLSGGVPRLINVICDRALLGAYVEDNRRVDRRIVRRAADEVLPEVGTGDVSSGTLWPWAAGIAFLVVAAGAWMVLPSLAPDQASRLASDMAAPVVGTADAALGTESADAPSALPDEAVAHAVASAPDSGEQHADVSTVAAIATDVGDPENVVPSADVGPSFVDRLLAVGDAGEELRAWAALFRLWGADFYLDGAAQPCNQAVREGLRCIARSGNWTQLRNFNRPAVLQMIAPDGRRVALLLRAVEPAASTATVDIGGDAMQVPIADIETHWHGQFVFLWRPPIGSETLRVGARGDDVVWLRGLLDRVQPEAADEAVAAPGVYDAALAERVRRFQLQHALEPDGVVGAVTLMHLDAADARAGGPRLIATAD